MAKMFQKATRKQVRLRMALDGPPGAGKTFTGLRFAFALAGENGRVAVINTESGAIEKYLGLNPDGREFDFDILTLKEYAPSSYTAAIQAAGREGYDVLLVDSLSHAWEGEGGALDQVDRKSSSGKGNSFTAWKDVTPQHRGMIEALLRSPCHVITTMRTKMDYVLEPDERGRMVPRKVGTKPIQREGMEYEFDIVLDLDQQHIAKVSKTRCPDIDGLTVMKPGAAFLHPVIHWLADGSQVDATHFAVNESDLKALEQATRPGAPGAQQQPIDVREQMRQRAASKTQAAPVVPPVGDVTPSTITIAELATSNQVTHIRDLYRHLNTPEASQAAILAKRGVNDLAELSTDAAAELIDGLMAMFKSQTEKAQEEMRLEQELSDQSAKMAKANQAAAAATVVPAEDDVPF